MGVFGGYDGSHYLNDTWALTLGPTPAWAQLTPAGTPPQARDLHTAVFDPVRREMTVFAGEYAPTSLLSGRLALAVGPQPCRGEARIAFDLPSAGPTRVQVFDLAGRGVATLAEGVLSEGRHQLRWRPAGAAPGVYWIRVRHGDAVEARSIVLIR